MRSLLVAALLVATLGACDGGVRELPVDADWDYQIGGPSRPADRVEVVTRDRTERPAGRGYDVCYVNAFQAQPDAERFWADPSRRDLVLRDAKGDPVIDEDWDEALLDLRTDAKRTRLAEIVGGWMRGCAAKGYDAVELDNLDSWQRSRRLLDKADALAYARMLVRRGHDEGVAVAQKNTLELGRAGPEAGFDFAVIEECGAYRECQRWQTLYDDRLLVVEYTTKGFAEACRVLGDEVAVERRDVDVTPKGPRAWC